MRQAEQKYLIEGIRLCEEALKSSDTLEQLIFCRESIARNSRLENLYQTTLAQRIPIQQTDWRAFKHMSETDTPQGVLGVVSMPTWDRKAVLNTRGPFLILDRISDPGNLGVIMRTAETAGCKGIFLTRDRSNSTTPKSCAPPWAPSFACPPFPFKTDAICYTNSANTTFKSSQHTPAASPSTTSKPKPPLPSSSATKLLASIPPSSPYPITPSPYLWPPPSNRSTSQSQAASCSLISHKKNPPAIFASGFLSFSSSHQSNSERLTVRPSDADRSAAKLTRWVSKAISKFVRGIGSLALIPSTKAWNCGS